MPVTSFNSQFRPLSTVDLPAFSGVRVMMMPLILGDLDSVPDSLAAWRPTLETLFALGGHAGEVGYITIDEKTILPGETHRRAGKHVDGIYRNGLGGWGGGWGSTATGMITVASHPACLAWSGEFQGWPGDEGSCEHLSDQCNQLESTLFEGGRAYWVHGLCVHESLPFETPVDRQFVRLSLPSTAPWFEGYTENPLGVRPTGPILPTRPFMSR